MKLLFLCLTCADERLYRGGSQHDDKARSISDVDTGSFLGLYPRGTLPHVRLISYLHQLWAFATILWRVPATCNDCIRMANCNLSLFSWFTRWRILLSHNYLNFSKVDLHNIANHTYSSSFLRKIWQWHFGSRLKKKWNYSLVILFRRSWVILIEEKKSNQLSKETHPARLAQLTHAAWWQHFIHPSKRRTKATQGIDSGQKKSRSTTNPGRMYVSVVPCLRSSFVWKVKFELTHRQQQQTDGRPMSIILDHQSAGDFDDRGSVLLLICLHHLG